MPLSFAELANDSDIGEEFTVLRTQGQFGLGGWIPNPPQVLKFWAIIPIAEDEKLRQTPEGDRVNGSIQVICADRIYETLAQDSLISDEILWHGNKYRVQSVGPWYDNDFFSAICVRMRGA